MAKEKIDKIYTSIIFLLFLFICWSSPLMGDDWGNYINGAGGIINSIKYAFGTYFSYEGRVMSRIFINILTYNKYLWNIVNPMIISLIYYFCLKIIVRKDKFITPALVLLTFLFVDVEGFRQVYVWLAGNITYLFPMLLVFYLLYLNRNLTFNPNKIERILLPVISFLFTLFVENVSVVIVGCYLFFIAFYYIKTKKIDYCLLVSSILALVGTLIMVLSPGNFKRLDTYPEFSSLSFFGKIIYNIPNFVNYTFIRNSLLVFLTSVVLILIINEKINNKPIKYLTWLYVSIIPLLTAFYNYFITLGMRINVLELLLDYNNNLIIIFWIIYIILTLVLVGIHIYEQKDIISLVLVVAGLMNNGAMMISPIWGGRTSYLTVICLSIAMIKLGQSYELFNHDYRIISFSSNLVLVMMIVFLLVGYRNVYISNLDRENYIKDQLEAGDEIIEIKILSERFLWNPNPWDSDGYLARTLKLYYQIPKDKKIVMVE